MTAKKKAKELIKKFVSIHSLNNSDAKRCALIAVDVILIDCGAKDWSGDEACEGKNYWQEVKQEIEKL